ncbi:uncharacterized protein LOC101891574 [Musca domestica]|uniref:Uncharacterized protein LOC101891574 n=1 Tax=Musca domestica TaxID=7370 RepID=A0A1I8MY94_MUSDO|nr:uncharacterized protein LOC101891574 [Musca domestica]
MKYLWIHLLVCFGLKYGSAQGFGMNLMKVAEDDPGQIVCTVALLEKYFHSGEALSGAVLHYTITSASLHLQKSLLQALHSLPKNPWSIVVRESNKRGDSDVPNFILHEKPQCYFMIIDNMDDEDMDEIFENWKLSINWNPLAQFVVYLSSVEETAEEMTDIMIEVLLNFMNKKIYNVNVIGQNEEETYYYGKSVFPYHPDNNCGNRVITIETLDLCDYQDTDKFDEDEDEEEDEEEEGEGEEEEEGEENEGEEEDHSKAEDESGSDDDDDSGKEGGEEDEEEKNTSESEDSNEMPEDGNMEGKEPKFYIEEMYRALFLDKFPKDLSGCPLVAAYRPWEPFIFNEALHDAIPSNNKNEKPLESEDNNAEDDYGDDENYMEGDDNAVESDYKSYEDDLTAIGVEVRLNGIEYKMIQTIAERLHISIDMQVENTNVYHLFQQLIDGDIEMVIGGIDEDPSISQYVSSTIPYLQDDLTWCVAKARRSHNLFNFMSTFDAKAWLLTLTFILTASLSIAMSQKFLKLRLHIMKSYFSINIYVMGVVLSQAVNLPRIPTSLQLCFGTTFFMGLIFSNVYQSFLISTLTTPKSSYQISHIEEIYANRMNVMGSVDNVRHLSKEGETFRYVREHFHMCYNIEECLHRAAVDPKLAVAVSRQHSFYNPRIPRDNLYCFDRNENIYVYLVTMLLPKKFHLLHKINPVIQHIIESGHLHKWARDLDMRRKIVEEIQRAHEEPFKSLTLDQVIGPFALHFILLLFALFVFGVELLVHWLVVQRRTRLKIAKCLHRKFL